jgi:lipopolysaccharide heptosyltransferase II
MNQNVNFDKTPWQKVKKILIIRLDNLGDVLMSTPAIKAVRKNLPSYEIVLLTSQVGAKIASLVPEINRTIIFNSPWVKNTEKLSLNGENINNIVKQLKKEKFDAAIIFTVYSQNPQPAALISFLADIPLRLAYSHENPYQLLSHWVPDPEPQCFIRHEVKRLLDLVGDVGYQTDDIEFSLKISNKASILATQKLKALNINSPYIIIHPGASDNLRRYSEYGFIKVGKEISKITKSKILVTGIESENDLVQNIVDGIGDQSINSAGLFSLEELCSVIKKSSLLICSNTGPAHIASVFKTPLVDIYAKTNLQHTPWNTVSKVLYYDVQCIACQRGVCPEIKHEITDVVTPQDIVQASLQLLNIPNYYETA